MRLAFTTMCGDVASWCND